MMLNLINIMAIEGDCGVADVVDDFESLLFGQIFCHENALPGMKLSDCSRLFKSSVSSSGRIAKA